MYSNTRSRGRSRRGPKPKWVNPCGIDPSFVRNHAIFSYHDVTPLSDQELIQNILLSAKNALVHSDDFKEKFVSRIAFTGLAFHQISGSLRDCSWLAWQYSASSSVHCSLPPSLPPITIKRAGPPFHECWYRGPSSTHPPMPPSHPQPTTTISCHIREDTVHCSLVVIYVIFSSYEAEAVAGLKMLSGCQEFLSYFWKMYLQL